MTGTAAAYSMPEAELQEAVRRMCAGLGLYHYHPRHSIGSEKGWPDSVIVGNRVLFRELKSEAGRLTREQTALGYKLKAAGANWKVWKPSDLLGGTIARELTEVAGVQAELFGA